jgi:Domain of unknown function (DUF5615)
VSDYAFAVDENVRASVVAGLRAAGVDILEGRIDMPGWKDAEILARCWREKRILLSHDYDHGDLVFRDGHPAFGVILLAPGLFIGSAAPNPFAFARRIGENPQLYVNFVTIISARGMRRKMINQSS